MVHISTVLYIVIAVLVFGVLIFVHELGHFFAAKACKIQVNEFAIGMGPKLFKFKRGETVFSLRAFPIGGFCAMEGEDEESANERSFGKRPIWQRLIVLIAGAFMNVLAGFIIIFCLTAQSGALGTTTIAQFRDNATSSQWLQEGDQIVSVNGSATHIVTDIQLNLIVSNAGTADIKVIRDGQLLDFPSVQFQLVDDGAGGKAMIQDFIVKGEAKTFGGIVYHSACWTVAVVKYVWVTVIKLLTGSYGIKVLSGPIGVTVAMGEAAQQSLFSLFYIVAMIAVNLGVVNLLPFPALDGGKIVLVIIEAFRRKPLNQKYESAINLVGFALLMVLFVVVTYNDILRTLGWAG